MTSHSGLISYAALNRSGRVLKAFSALYLGFHGLSIDTLFSQFGLWTFVEAMAYEADESNEHTRSPERSIAILQAIKSQLRSLRLFDQECAAELENAKKYFLLEQLFRHHSDLSYDQILTCAALRSFDFRLLHRLLWKTQGWTYDENTFEAFHVFEQAMEFDDDYTSLDKDLRAKTFNVCAALSSIGNDCTGQYVEKLRSGVIEATGRFGKNYKTLLETYRALVPGTILTNSSFADLRHGDVPSQKSDQETSARPARL